MMGDPSTAEMDAPTTGQSDLTLVKGFAIACEVAYVSLVVTMIVMVPSAMRSPVPWTLLAVVTLGVLLTHVAASAVGRHRSSHP